MFLSLSPEQREVIYAIEDGHNVFVTGRAGTGKSYLLKYLKNEYINKGLHITASTGIAAVQVGGRTLHSWAGLGLGNMPVHQMLRNLFSAKGSRLRRKIKNAKMLAIDEVSMISSKTLDTLNELLKGVKENDKPFGGIQLILFGDFLQLPPVFKNFDVDDMEETFCFLSDSWGEANIRHFLLKKVFRQDEEEFIGLLNNIRYGTLTHGDVDILRQRYEARDNEGSIRPTKIVTHNAQVDRINRDRLKEIPSRERVFKAEFDGSEAKCEFLRKNSIAPEELTLKIGAQVMMLKNTYQKDGVINGSLGIIRDFSAKKGYPVVEFSNGEVITVGREVWAIESYDEKTGMIKEEASMSQIPLNLSWAITVHKSQGMTLDKVECDLAKAFADGQIYVALSRARTLDGLFIKSFDADKVSANPQIVEFYRAIEEGEC